MTKRRHHYQVPRRPPSPLGTTLRRLAGWAVATSLSAAAGCDPNSRDSAPTPADRTQATGLQPSAAQPDLASGGRGDALPAAAENTSSDAVDGRRVACNELFLPTDPIKPPKQLDYLGMYITQTSWGPLDQPYSRLRSDLGDPCRSAHDAVACLDELARVQAPSLACRQATPCIPVNWEAILACRPPEPCKTFAIVTHGDVVQRIEDASELSPWLGTIDTDSEAVVIAMLHGFDLGCDEGWLDTATGTYVQDTADGYRVRSNWAECDGLRGHGTIDVHRDGSVSALELLDVGYSGCISGRRPAGLCSQPQRAHSEPLASYFAHTAELEAASIYAFERLASELTRLGAPSDTIHAARRAADDEARHARMTARLARRYGFRGDTRPRIQATGERSPLAIAIENAVEGCVRETFGALIAQHQAVLARDPLIASSMRSIAVDETRHAELAWQVAEWLEPRLSEADRKVLARAREAALLQLAQEITRDPLSASTREQLGLPEAALQHALLERMASSLALA